MLSDSKGPLEDLNIIDMTRHMAGPYGAAILADYGANVIKIEPTWGDQARFIGRDYVDGVGGLFLCWNREKRSIAIDYRTPEGREALERLIAGADVFLHNFRPRVAREAQLDFATLKEINPRLVHASVSGFGERGPWSDRPATDPIIQAMSGVMSVTGERGGSPVLAGIPVADFTSAMWFTIGILIAVHAQRRTGEPQEVHVSMLAGLMSGLQTRLSSVLYGDYEPERMGSSHAAVMPFQAFETKDGYVFAGAWAEGAWPRFCRAVNLPELADDERFRDNLSRINNRDELEKILKARFLERTAAEWEQSFNESDALFGHVYTIAEALEQEQAVANELVIDVQHTKLGQIKMLAPPVSISSAPKRPMTGSPLLGEHSVAVLRAIGYTPDEIAELVEGGVVIDGSS